MKSENFVVIQGWMCNELELKGNDLLVFALIYGFSQDGESAFHGSRNYIANTFNISKPTVDKALQNLLDKGYIKKHISGDITEPNTYWADIEVVKKLYMGSKETLLGGSKETLLNNTSKSTNSKKEKLVSNKDTNTEFTFGNQKPKKQNLYTKCVSLIDQKTNNNEIRSLLIDWLNMLLEKYKSTGRVLYVNVFKGKLKMLNDYDEKDWKEIIKYNIQKGYEGFYPTPSYNRFYPIPSYNYKTDLKDKPWEKGVKSEAYTEEEKRQIEREREEMEARGERVWY